MNIIKRQQQSYYQTADLAMAAAVSLFLPIEDIDKSHRRISGI